MKKYLLISLLTILLLHLNCQTDSANNETQSSKGDDRMLLNEQVRKEVKEMLKDLKDDVALIVFTQKIECQYCEDNRMLAKEVAELSDKVTATIYNFQMDKEQVETYNIDKIPAIAVIGKEDYGIRFYGIPGGYEFTSFITAIQLVSKGESTLSPEAVDYIKSLDKDVHIQVFVTPTCPYCPRAVTLAHQMAYISPKVRADMVESTEFPHLVNKYHVQGVPRTVINETVSQEGAAPDSMIIEKIKEALK